MRRRLIESFGVATAIATVAVLLQLAAVPVEGQAPSETPWGHPNLEGIWLDVYATPFERPAELGDREFFTAAERAERDQARMVNPGRNARGQDGRTDVAGAYNAVYTSARPAGPRTSLVVDPPNGRIPDLTPETRRRNEVEREWRLMLLRSTETCRVGGSGCAGGEYAPASPRRFDVVPFYNTGRMNRHFGPEDQSLGDRCMSGRTPDFNGFRRIVQGEDSIAIGYDTGQGQGYPAHRQPERKPSAGPDPACGTGTRAAAGRARRWSSRPRTSRPSSASASRAGAGVSSNAIRASTRTRLAYEVTIEDPAAWVAPWTVRQELKRQSDRQNRIYYEPRCHEGNYGLPALLIGARVDEQAFAEGRGPDPFSLDTATCVTGLQD